MGTPEDMGDDVPIGGAAVITVTEGFADAWEGDAALGGTSIAIVVNELPAGVRLMWPAEAITFYDPADPTRHGERHNNRRNPVEQHSH